MKKLYKTITCILVVLAVITQCGCNALNFRQEYNKGMYYYEQKNYTEAIVSLNKALEYKPDSYSATCLLGASYAYKKDYKLAEKTFQDAIKLHPNEWNAYVLLADLKKRQKDYQSAIDFYETAVTLESMGGKEKLYYKDYIKKLKEEQSIYASKDPVAERQAKEKFKSEIIKAYAKDRPKDELKKQTGEVILSLDPKKWTKVSEQKDDKSITIQYGLNGEDVKNFLWTKLVTVQYFILTDNFNTTLNDYFMTHTGAIAAAAKNSQKPFEKKIISQSKTEIVYEWDFGNGIETEVARIVYTPKGIYHIHMSKKGKFTNEEKVQYLELLKSALLR